VSHLVIAQYDGMDVTFKDDGWFNATAVAKRYGQNPNDWWRLPATQRYVAALDRKYGKIPYLKTQRGKQGGTWLHPKLAVRFAQWLDDDFAVWCDEQIQTLINGTHSSHDRSKLRHEAAATYKVMSAVLQIARQTQGKGCQPHHFMAEAKLVNWALAGEFKGLDRDSLDSSQLDLLAKLEELNTVLIGSGADYVTRKPTLQKYAEDWRRARIMKLVA